MQILSNLSLYGTLGLNSVADANTDTDKFLVIDSSGIVKYRTGAELYNDIGAGGAAAYTSVLQHTVKAGVALTKGQAVYVTSADGTNMIVGKASNASEATSSKTLGLIVQDLAINDQGFVVTEGLLAGLDTSTANAGDPVWLGTDGNLIYGLLNKPYAPNHLVFIGIVTRAQQNNGEIFVKVQNGFELQELHNVQITSTPSDNAVLAYETSTSLYKMKSIPTLLGYTPVTNARSITINGTTYDLSADRSWSVGTHTGNLTTGYVPKATGATTLTDSLIYDNGSGIGINTSSPYESSAFKLDVNGGLLIKNTSGTTAQLVLINSNPATGGNNGFVQLSAGGNTETAFGQWQTYYGMSVASGALRLQPAGGQVLIGTTTTSAFLTDINGTLRVSGQLTLGSTISNNTYVYTMPGASGTLALVSQIPSLSGYLTIASADATYLTQSSAASIYLSQTSASNTYLTISGAASTYLSQASASNTYLTISGASSIYLSQTSASNTYLTINGASSIYLSQTSASNTYLTINNAASAYVSLSGSYANPSWITSLAWSKITGAPAFLTSYTETDTLASVTGRGATTSSPLYFSGGSSTTPALHIRSGGSNWSEGLAIHPLTDNTYALAFFRTKSSYTDNTDTWALGNMGETGIINHFALLRRGLTGSSVNGSGNAVFSVNPNGTFSFGFTPNVGSNAILHAGNYNSYSPTLTGGGASGTWGINITGSSQALNFGGGSVMNNSAWAGTGGYHGYTYSGGNFRFGFSSTSGVVDVYADGNFYATDSGHLVLHAGNYNSYSPTLTGGGASGTWGINITGGAASANLASNSNLLNGISVTQIFNNMGQGHSAITSFDSSTPSYDFGFRFVQGSANGPGTGGSQYYSWYIGLGSQYPATGGGSYGAMFAVDRDIARPYLSVRYNENNGFGSWRRIAAGYADTAGALSSMNISQFTNNSGYVTGGPYLPLSGGTMSGSINMSGTQIILSSGFSGIEYHNTSGQWEGFVGTESGTGHLRYNSRLGNHTWYSNSSQAMKLNSGGTLDVYRIRAGGSTHDYEASEGVIRMQNNQANHNYIVSNGAGWGSWNQWIRYVAGVNTWRIGTYDDGNNTGNSVWRLAGVNRGGAGEINYIVAGPRGGWGSNDRVVLWNPYARYDNGDWQGNGTNYKILDALNVGSYALPIGGGTLTGGRTIQFDTGGGAILVKGDTGGWSMGTYYRGSSNTVLAGFGAYGGGNSLTWAWIGPGYESPWITINSGETVFNNPIVTKISGGFNTYDTALSVRGNASNPAIITFHRPGFFATNFGLDTDNQIKIGGWSNGGPWVVLHANNFGSYALPLSGGTLTSRTYLHQAGGGGGENLFTGLDAPSSANGRAQFVLASAYSDLVIASSQANGNHGSTLTFATYNPGNAADYRKFVINQGNWGARAGFLDFGFADAGGRSNPHLNINATDDVMSLDGYNKRVGINIMNPGYALDVNGLVNTASGYVSVGNPWGTANSAFFPNGITTAGGTNWVYGLTYLGNAPSNGSGAEVASNGRIYVRANSAAASHGFAGLFVDRNSASSNHVPWSFENEWGNHSWGLVARFHIQQSGADRPSIQFSSSSSNNRWSIGYVYPDDNFRITQNHGFRPDGSGNNDGWGTERLRINTDGTTYLGVQGQIVYFNGAESANLYGIRGRFTNEYIHLYNKVGIGHPGGWGAGEGNTPTFGLSTYGGVNIGYGNSGGLTVNGTTTINGTLNCDALNTGNYINIGYNRNGESVSTSAFRGIDWHTTGDFNYYIGKPAGGWTQPLHIHFYTGVRLRTHSSYGGTQFFNINGSVTTATVNDGDNNMRGFYDIIAYASDRRLKENVQVIDNAVDKIMQLTGMTYSWNNVGTQYGWSPSSEREVGVFAQDVQAVLPEAVKLAPFDNEGGKSKSGENFLTVKYEKIVPLLIEAIKEQQQQIEELQNKLDAVTK